MHFKTRDMVLIALFTALICIGTFIKIPIPPVPITLQTLFAVLAGLILGKRGAIAAGLYVVLGFIGVPVFTAGGGPAYVFQPTFGYIIGLVLGAFVCGVIPKKSFISYMLASLAGMLAIYVVGVPYLYFMMNAYGGTETTFLAVLGFGFLQTIPKDIVVGIIAAAIAYKVNRTYRP